MAKTLSSFALVALLTAALAALSIALAQKGYPQGATGLGRLDALASASTFIPLAALYAASCILLLVLPLRAASYVLVTTTDTLFWTTVALLAAILGVALARFAFGQSAALHALVDWRFVFAAAIIGCHFALNALRRNVLLRTLGLIGFAAAVLLSLYWTFDF